MADDPATATTTDEVSSRLLTLLLVLAVLFVLGVGALGYILAT